MLDVLHNFLHQCKGNNIFLQKLKQDVFKCVVSLRVSFAHGVNSGSILSTCAKDLIGEELFLHLVVLDLHVHGVPLI